jgi:hypothetical protein
MESKVLGIIEEQIVVGFTGKINILASFNRQYLGQILFKNGEVIQVTFNGQIGLKAFYQLIVQEYSLQSFEYIVEPEVVEDHQRKIHYPYSVLKNKLSDVIKLYRESLKHRPPDNIKIVIEARFMDKEIHVTPEEFEVLETLTEWNSPHDIYHHSRLMDHEVTMSLVSLRKKGALKIVALRQ